MGYNQYGQLGDGTSIDHLVTEKIFSGSTSLSISAMAGGEYHSLFGTYSSISPATTGLRVMGANGLGELGDGTDIARNSPEQVENTTPISAVAAGYGHSLYLKSDTSISLSGTDVVLTAANGAPDENIYTLVGTNATQSLSQWDCVATNTLSAYGNFTITVTNAASPAAVQRYFILLAQ
jgi:alpha-tubulin suppressor-like RCC1 family protein